MSKDNKSVTRRRQLKVRQQYNGPNKGGKYKLHRKHIEQREPQQKVAPIALL